MRSFAAAAAAVLALIALPSLASAQLGTYHGCSLYACETFTFAEVGRTGPALPLPGAPLGEFPENVPSWSVTYAISGVTTLLPQAITDGLLELQPTFAFTWLHDGEYGESGGPIMVADLLLTGHAAGDVFSWAVTPGPMTLTGFVPVDGAVATGVGFNDVMYDVWISPAGGSPTAEYPIALVAPVTPVTSAPEPATLALLGAGLLALGAARRRRA